MHCVKYQIFKNKPEAENQIQSLWFSNKILYRNRDFHLFLPFPFTARKNKINEKTGKNSLFRMFFFNFYFVLICYHKVKLKVKTFQGPSKNLGQGRSLKFNTYIVTHSLYEHKNFQRGQSMRELVIIILNFPVRPYLLTRENNFRS